MKKVLLIGYPFPLRRGGSPRLLGLAKYLPEFGWQPIILTAPLSEKSDNRYNIVETGYREAAGFWRKLFRLNPEKDLRKQIKSRFGINAKKSFLDSLLTLVGDCINYPDSDKGWKPFAIKTGKDILDREDISAIISTSAPVTGHIIARELKSRHNIPWVADLRDLWTQNHNYSYSRLRKMIDKRLELKTLGAADALVTVSQPWADKLGTLHKGRPIYSITNGFDPNLINIPPIPLTTRFTISYTGTIYPHYQDPALLFSALKELISQHNIDPERFEVRFFGSREEWLEKEAVEYGLAKIVRQYGQVTRDESLQRQRESQILMLLNWDDPAENGTIPGKIFEYMAALRPVIAIGGSQEDVIQKILTETKIGSRVSSIADAKEWLHQKYSEYTTTGVVSQAGNQRAIEKYSQRQMAGKFANILNQITNPENKS